MSMTDIELSEDQEQAMTDVCGWLRNRGKQVFILNGYAGTGKSTIIERLLRDFSGTVAFCAPTGKAAEVMQRKGCSGARTVHSLIYMPVEEARQKVKDLRFVRDGVQTWADLTAADTSNPFNALDVEVYFKPELARQTGKIEELRQQLDPPRWIKRDKIFGMEDRKKEPRLIVVDEAPMVSEEVARDLLSFGIPVLAVGDPFQLPPIGNVGPFHTDCPDAMLVRVHRHALESAVMRMATEIRERGRLSYDENHRRYSQLRTGELSSLMTAADQIIVGTHKTRLRITPAYGDETALRPTSRRPVPDHPRVRGRDVEALLANCA